MNRFILVLMWVAIIGVLAFGVFVFVKYGNMPISELPAWVVPFFLHR